ncbi:TraX family protein [Anaerolentibacter hominis]|uniref:TraX family protein n=1 Tax=Anaerolentibacter hominis TaxID=3079009 RepID=UPI0031B8AC88
MSDKTILMAGVQPAVNQRGITGTGLKVIALVSMLMDHIYYFFGYTGLIPWWFGLAGRLAAPLFLFCLVEGFLHTRSRRKYLFKMLCISVPMGLLLFFMRFGGFLVRPDGFYPQNAMMSSFVLLIVCFQAFDWIASRKIKKAAAGCGVLLLLLAWPFLAAAISGTGPVGATAAGILGYTLLPMLNISGDVTLPILLTGIVLYLTHKHRGLQIAAMIIVNFAWHFVFVYLQVRTWPGFELSQMFTMYYEWMGAVFAAPLLLCYNGKRGAGYGKLFYAFYPAHIYILYGLSWLLMAALG